MILKLVQAKDYLSIDDCSLMLSVSQSTIKRLIDDGDLLGFNVRSRVLIARTDLDSYCKQELKKTKFKKDKPKPISNKAKHFNIANYFFMGEIPKYYNLSSKSVERHIKSNGVEKIKKGRFNYVLKSDIKKLFGAPTKSIING